MTDQTITLLPLDAIVASTINPRDKFTPAALARRMQRERAGAGQRPITNATSTTPYDYAELRPFEGRQGALDAFALPSRMGRFRHYRDGRVEEVAA